MQINCKKQLNIYIPFLYPENYSHNSYLNKNTWYIFINYFELINIVLWKEKTGN